MTYAGVLFTRESYKANEEEEDEIAGGYVRSFV